MRNYIISGHIGSGLLPTNSKHSECSVPMNKILAKQNMFPDVVLLEGSIRMNTTFPIKQVEIFNYALCS